MHLRCLRASHLRTATLAISVLLLPGHICLQPVETALSAVKPDMQHPAPEGQHDEAHVGSCDAVNGWATPDSLAALVGSAAAFMAPAPSVGLESGLRAPAAAERPLLFLLHSALLI